MKFRSISSDVRDIIREANRFATNSGSPRVIGYLSGMGWTHYDPRDDAPPGIEPELLCFALGALPLPLSEIGAEVLFSALNDLAQPC